jgi:hypothetical protein
MILSVLVTMRGLHRPLHDKFIYSSDWDKMSAKQTEMALENGKIRLPSRSEFKNMSKEEARKWSAIIRPILDDLQKKILMTFRQIPKSFLLVFR